MHAETFLKEFAPLASGPGGVQKLRELVLQLAVRGRLSSTLATDDNIDELISVLPHQIEQQIATGQGTKRKVIEYDTTEPPFHVPQTWQWLRLDQIASYIQRGKSPTYADRGRVKIISQKCVQWTGFVDSPCRHLDDDAFGKFGPERLVQTGDLLWNSTGTGTIGRVNIFDSTPYGDQQFVADSHVTVVRLAGCDPRYIWCFLASPDIQRTLESDASGSTNQVELSTAYVRNTWIPLPPHAEQKRIVVKADELMALCDALEARQAEETGLKRAAAAAALYRLAKAESPRETVNCWSLFAPHFGEIFKDLETIKALRQSTFDMALGGSIGDHNGAPEWETKSIGDLEPDFQNGLASRGEDGGEPTVVLRLADVDGTRLSFGQTRSLNVTPESRAKYTVEDGDILILRVNGSADLVGKFVLVTGAPNAVYCDHFIRMRLPKHSVYPRFIEFAGQSSDIRSSIKSLFVTTAGQKTVNQRHIRSLRLSLPPLDEQKNIVAKVDELIALCDRLEEQVREGVRLNAELMVSLVHTLTETDPDGGCAATPTGFAEDTPAVDASEPANADAAPALETESGFATPTPESKTQAVPEHPPRVDSKFQEAVLVAAIVGAFFEAGGEPIGNFRLQKAVYFARRRMGEHVGEMAYLKKAAGPYNPSMKYSGGIAIAKRKNWLREARGRFGFGHVPGLDASEAAEWIGRYAYEEPAQWVAEQFRFKKNEEWETLATVDYAIEHLQTLGIDPDATQILQYIRADDEWRPKIEKLGLTEMSVGTAMAEVRALFEGGK